MVYIKDIFKNRNFKGISTFPLYIEVKELRSYLHSLCFFKNSLFVFHLVNPI